MKCTHCGLEVEYLAFNSDNTFSAYFTRIHGSSQVLIHSKTMTADCGHRATLPEEEQLMVRGYGESESKLLLSHIKYWGYNWTEVQLWVYQGKQWHFAESMNIPTVNIDQELLQSIALDLKTMARSRGKL